jgi:hypothetical protein
MRKVNAASAALLVVATVVVERTGHGAAFSSRGCMSSGVPVGLKTQHRVVLVGDHLSWDSADYKLSAAVEVLPAVEEVLFVQVDEVDEDLLALQLRSFDPDTVLVSVRTRAFERLPWTVLRIARSECRRGDNIVVLVLQLQAHTIPVYDRAFARVGTWRADGSHAMDTFESRADREVREVLRLYVDDVGPLDEDDLLAGGLHMEWFGPSVPERWCSELQACDQRPCAGHDALHDIIVLVSAGDCGVWSGGEGGEGDGYAGDGGCTEARYLERRCRGRQVLLLHAVNTSAAWAHLMRARGGKTVEDRVHGDMTATRELLTSAKVLVMAEAAGTAVQHAVECMALGGPAVVMSAHSAASAGVDDIINATNALVYRTGDLEGLGLLLDQLLSDAHVEEEPGVEGGGAGGSSGRVWRCELQQRACEDACIRHGMVYKVATMIRSEHASAQELGEKAHAHTLTAGEQTAGDLRSTEGISNQVEALEGLNMDLGALLPHNNVSFHANIVHLSHFSTAHRSVPPSVIFAEVPK